MTQQIEIPSMAALTARYFYAKRDTPAGQLALLTMAAHEDLFQAYRKAGDKVAEAYGLPRLKAFKFQMDNRGRVANVIIYRVENDMHPDALLRLHPDLMPVKGLSVKAWRYGSKSKQAKGLAKLVGKVEQYENFQHFLTRKLAESTGTELTGDLLRHVPGTVPCVDGSLAVAVAADWGGFIELFLKSGFVEIDEQTFNLRRAEALDVGEGELVRRMQATARAVDQQG